MKRVYPDIGDILRSKYISQMGAIRKFIRLWGTTTVQGQEVFNLRQYYYPASYRSEDFEALFKFLGAYEDVTTAKMKGVKRAWIYLNRNKATTLSPSFNPFDYDPFVLENLQKLWWNPEDGDQPENLSLTTTIVIEPNIVQSFLTQTQPITTYDSDGNPVYNSSNNTQHLPKYTDILDPAMPDELLATTIVSRYQDLWDTCKITHQGVGVINHGTSTTNETTLVEVPDKDDLSPDDPWLQTLSRYVLLYSDIPCTITKVEKGLGNSSHPYYHTDNTGTDSEVGDTLYTTYVVTLEIPFYEFSLFDTIVNDISDDIVEASLTQLLHNTTGGGLFGFNFANLINFSFFFNNSWITRQAITAMDSTDLEDEPDLLTRPYTLWEDISDDFTDTQEELRNLWIKEGKNYYLKADPFINPWDYGLRYSQLGEFLFPIIDTGYKKKSASFFKKLVAFVVAVVATVILGPQIGWALAIVLVSVGMAIMSIALTAAGFEEWGMAFAEVNQTLEPLVKIASIYLMVTGIMNAYNAAADALKNAAADAATQAALDAGASQAAAQAAGQAAASALQPTFFDVIGQMFTSMIGDYITTLKDLVTGNFSMGGDPTKFVQFAQKAVELVNKITELKLKELRNELKDLRSEYSALAQEMADSNHMLLQYMQSFPKQLAADWSIYAEQYDLPYETGQGTIALGNIQRTTVQAMREGDYNDPAFSNVLGYPLAIT